jgi:hypothetical protein
MSPEDKEWALQMAMRYRLKCGVFQPVHLAALEIITFLNLN